MKNILYILVTLALFSYIVAMPADDSEASKAEATADSVAQKGRDTGKKAEGTVNDSTKGKGQLSTGPLGPLMSMMEIPGKLFTGFAEMGDKMAESFSNGLKKELEKSNN